MVPVSFAACPVALASEPQPLGGWASAAALPAAASEVLQRWHICIGIWVPRLADEGTCDPASDVRTQRLNPTGLCTLRNRRLLRELPSFCCVIRADTLYSRSQAIADMRLAADSSGSGFAVHGLASKAMRAAPPAHNVEVRCSRCLLC